MLEKLEKRVSLKLAFLILVLTAVLTFLTGYVSEKVYFHNSYDLDSRLEEKLPQILETLNKDPENYDARIQLGMVYLQRMEWEKGIEHLLIAKELNPTDPDLLYQIGRAYGQMGNWREAEKHFLEAYSLDQNHDLTLFALGQLAQNHGELEEALDYYQRAVKIDKKPEYQETVKSVLTILGQKEISLTGLETGDIDEAR